jgi:hypothetical protein
VSRKISLKKLPDSRIIVFANHVSSSDTFH